MKNLTTQKIVFGILMALVLAFSVQSTADAITKITKTSSTDNQIVEIQQPFTIRFSVSLQGSQRIPDSAGTGFIDEDDAAIDRSGYFLHANGHFLNAAGLPIDSQGYIRDGTDGAHRDPKEKASDTTRTKTTPLKQYHFNEESISITATSVPTGGSITFTKGSTEVTGLSEHAETSDERLSSSISLSCRADTAGVYTITIADTTGSDDTPTGYTAATSITFTITVLQAPATSRGLTVTSGLEDTLVGEFGMQTISVTVSDTTANARVEFEITKGPGSLSAENTIGSKTSKRLSTLTGADGVATVKLDPKKGTNHVRAWIYGNPPGTTSKSTEGIYIYRWAILNKVSGDSGDSGDPQQNQKGPVSSRLEEPFVVQLFDSTGRTTIPGAVINFRATATPSGSLRYDPSTPSNLRGGTLASDATTATVKTDSNGKASVFLVLGATVGEDYTVTAAHTLSDTKTFTASSFASTVTLKAQSIRKVASTDGQSANQYGELEKPLTVVVRDQGGRRLAHTDDTSVIVTFVTLNGGDLIAPTTSEPGTLSDETGALNTDRAKDIETDVNGEASVRYIAPEEGGRRTVRASINNGLKSVVFTINGTPSGDTGDDGEDDDDDDDPPPTRVTRTLDIDVSGTGRTREVTVTALQNGVSQRGISVSLSVSSGASLSRTSGGTPLESTLTLPDTAGTYTLRASTTADYTTATEDIEVTVPGTLSISTISLTTGAQQVAVTARRNGSLQGDVNFTISGSGIVPATGVTTAAGSGNAILNFPRIGTYALTVRADGYDDLPVSVRITTAGQQSQQQSQQQQQQRSTTGGEAESIEIAGNRQLSGTVNQAMRLRARVLDANDNGVSDVRVTFRVLAPGKGRLSQRGNGRAVIAETDRNGYATASLTPLGGNLIVEAKAAGVSAPVSFIIDIEGATGSATTGDTTAPRTYNVGDKIPVSLEGTLTFRGSRTLSGMTYTCVGSGECVISYGLVVKGQIQASPVKTTAPREYNVGDKIPISLEDTLTFRGSRTLNGTTYTCVGSGECVISYGLVAKGQIQVRTAPSTSSTGDAAPRTTEINPVVKVNAANRPPMLWVDGGKIYALVGAEVQEFISGVEGAMNIAIAGNKVYWTEKTGESAGTINSANLDGSGAKELTAIKAVPIGITVDTARSKLYWTNSRGRIQSANLDGSSIRNLRENWQGHLMDLALFGDDVLYLTQGGESFTDFPIERTDLRTTAGDVEPALLDSSDTSIPKSIRGTPGSLAIAGRKIYWTTQTGTSSGSINSINLDGTGATQLASIRAVPRGIAVDTARSKLYWTNSRGRIQSANLDGSKIQNVVDGLGMPGDMVLSNSLQAPTATTTPPKSTTPDANYDVDGSGSVDNVDVFLVALAVGTPNAKYDVNGDGTVDDKDIALVRDNRDDGAAAAPMIVGMKLSADQIGRLQEQIDLLVASGDRSPATLKTLVYLQQLIATARPAKTQLLANFPNPFNPETWMPYELATDTDVRLTIYNAQGVVVRVLALGHQSAGYYTGRDRAAYWDGRNALGEQVASGIYFYQLETDEMSALRKMVILK